MGTCCEQVNNINNGKIPDLEKLYKDAGLPTPNQDAFKNNNEKEFYMIVGLIRQNPELFHNHVKNFVCSALFEGKADICIKPILSQLKKAKDLY